MHLNPIEVTQFREWQHFYQETTQKLKQSVISQGILDSAKSLIQIFEFL